MQSFFVSKIAKTESILGTKRYSTMGTLYFSQTNNNLDNTEFQSKFQLNNNLDETNTNKENQSESKQIPQRKCQCGNEPNIFFLRLLC